MIAAVLAMMAQDTVWRGRATEALTSQEYTVAPFDRAVVSWNSSGAATFELEVDGAWHVMGKWGDKPESVKADAVRVDTLVIKRPATTFRFRATLRPPTFWPWPGATKKPAADGRALFYCAASARLFPRTGLPTNKFLARSKLF